VVGGDRPL